MEATPISAATPPGERRPCALVTGASRGIGRELALALAADGHDLVVTARTGAALDELCSEIGQRFGVAVTPVVGDLGAPGFACELYNVVTGLGWQVDVLVNNAGFGLLGEFMRMPEHELLELVQLNVTSLLELCRLFGADMVDRGSGRILNVASVSGFVPGPLMAAYHASKAFVVSLSRGLACELQGSGVTVTCLCPGVTMTGFNERAGVGESLLGRRARMDAVRVARTGLRGMRRGRAVVIPGLHFKAIAWVSRVAPQGIATAMTRRAMSSVTPR